MDERNTATAILRSLRIGSWPALLLVIVAIAASVSFGVSCGQVSDGADDAGNGGNSDAGCEEAVFDTSSFDSSCFGD